MKSLSWPSFQTTLNIGSKLNIAGDYVTEPVNGLYQKSSRFELIERFSSFPPSGLAILAETAMAKKADWALAGMSGMFGQMEVGGRVDCVKSVKLVYAAILKGF